LDSGELRVLLVERMNKVLDLGHAEFANPEKAIARGNFIPKAKTDLSRSEGHSVLIIV
jgi:hypothetical protein